MQVMQSPLETYKNFNPASRIHNAQATLLNNSGAPTRIANDATVTTNWQRGGQAVKLGLADGWNKGVNLGSRIDAAVKNAGISPVLGALPYAASGVVLPFVGNVASVGVSPVLQLLAGDGLPATYASNDSALNVLKNTGKLIKEYGVAGLPEAAFNAGTGYFTAAWAKQACAIGAIATGFVPGVARSAAAIGSVLLFNVAPGAIVAIVGAITDGVQYLASPSKAVSSYRGFNGSAGQTAPVELPVMKEPVGADKGIVEGTLDKGKGKEQSGPAAA